jgi:hypothetical protein
MSLLEGTRLGPYEILGLLGAHDPFAFAIAGLLPAYLDSRSSRAQIRYCPGYRRQCGAPVVPWHMSRCCRYRPFETRRAPSPATNGGGALPRTQGMNL